MPFFDYSIICKEIRWEYEESNEGEEFHKGNIEVKVWTEIAVIRELPLACRESCRLSEYGDIMRYYLIDCK